MRDPKAIVVIVHGIHQSRHEAGEWMGWMSDYLETRAKLANTSFAFAHFKYGWTSGASIALPLWGWLGRRGKVRRFQRFVLEARQRYGADLPVHVVTHSFGGWIARYSLVRGKDEMRPRLSTLVMMASPTHARDRFTCGRVAQVWNLFSREDNTIRFARSIGFGGAGLIGLLIADEDAARLHNVDKTPFEHHDYIRGGKGTWDKVADILCGPIGSDVLTRTATAA